MKDNKKNLKEFPCIESTLDITHGDMLIRLWINLDSLDDFYRFDFLKIKREIEDNMKRVYIYDNKKFSNFEIQKMIEICSKNIPNLNAIQITKTQEGVCRVGMVVYTVDFANDVHG